MKKRHPYLNLLVTIWTYAKGMRPKLILTYLMFVMANLMLLAEPYFLGKFLNVIQEGGDKVLINSAIYLGAYVGLSFCFWVFHGPARCMERVMSFQIFRNFSDRMFYIVTKLPLKWHKDNHSGTTIDKISRASRVLREFTEEMYVYVETIIRFVGSVAAIVWIMKWEGFYLLLFGVVVVFVITRFDRVLTTSLREINKKEHKVASVFFDYVSNISTIITLRLERLAKNEFLKKIKHVFPIFRKNIVVNEVKWFVVSMLLMVVTFSVMMLYVYRTFSAEGTVMVGTLIMLYGYVNKFVDVFFGLAWRYERLVMTSTTLGTVDSILGAYEKMYRGKNGRPIHKDWKKIEISDLNFKYEDEGNHKHVLKDVGIVLGKGKRVALVGESGGGKSTLLTLLRGLSFTKNVDVEVDGKDVNGLDLLKNITTLIPQDPEIFENTIGYNITMGIPHKKKDVMKAVKLACFDKVLKKLPNGLETSIREKGVNLSGGEKQRLALARGIFAAEGSDIILLDEPTSSVDSVNEWNIYNNLLKKFKGKCLVSTVHRLHLLNLFDMIYVIDKGKVVESGGLKELLTIEGGVLRKLWDRYE